MTAVPALGDVAPDFTLADTHGTPVTLSELRGAPVALVFIPFAFTGICTDEVCELRDNVSTFADAGVTLYVVSCDPSPAQRAWAEQEQLTFDLLSDFWPHGDVARAYGVFDEKAGRALRGSFLLDAAGVVVWSVVNPAGQARDITGYREALARL